MPLGHQNQTQEPLVSEAYRRAQTERAKRYLRMIREEGNISVEDLVVAQKGLPVPVEVLVRAASELSGRSVEEIEQEFRAHKPERKQNSNTNKRPKAKEKSRQEPSVGGVAGGQLTSRAERRREARAVVKARKQLNLEGPVGAAPFPRALIRAVASSDHDRLTDPVDRKDVYGRVVMDRSFSFIGKKLVAAVGKAAIQGDDIQPLWEVEFSYGQLERYITTRRCKTPKRQRFGRGVCVSGGGMARRLRDGLVQLEQTELRIVSDSDKAGLYEWNGTIVSEVRVNLGGEHGEVLLRDLDAYAAWVMERGGRDPRRCIGARTSIVVKVSPSFHRALADKQGHIWCDLDTICGLTSAVDLNTYLFFLAQSRRGVTPWERKRGYPPRKQFYFPTVQSDQKARDERRAFRMLGINDCDLVKARELLIESAERVAQRVPGWGAVYSYPHKTNTCEWLVIEQNDPRRHGCPAELRHHKTPSRRVLQTHRSAQSRRQVKDRVAVNQYIIDQTKTTAADIEGTDGAQGASKARQVALDEPVAA